MLKTITVAVLAGILSAGSAAAGMLNVTIRTCGSKALRSH